MSYSIYVSVCYYSDLECLYYNSISFGVFLCIHTQGSLFYIFVYFNRIRQFLFSSPMGRPPIHHFLPHNLYEQWVDTNETLLINYIYEKICIYWSWFFNISLDIKFILYLKECKRNFSIVYHFGLFLPCFVKTGSDEYWCLCFVKIFCDRLD